MCHVRMVVRRSTLAYHNFVFGSNPLTPYQETQERQQKGRGYNRRKGEKEKSRKGQGEGKGKGQDSRKKEKTNRCVGRGDGWVVVCSLV